VVKTSFINCAGFIKVAKNEKKIMKNSSVMELKSKIDKTSFRTVLRGGHPGCKVKRDAKNGI
jgi:hypothetical protein